MLSDFEILEAIRSGKLVISNFDEKRLNPNSYDVTLSPILALPQFAPVVDPLDKATYHYQQFDMDQSQGMLILPPNAFILAAVNEETTFVHHTSPVSANFFEGNITATLTGKSSLARLGLLVHVTAGLADVGWKGYYILELKNLSQSGILLRSNMAIAQIEFHHTGPVQRPYGHKELNSKYQNQLPGQGSLYYLNKETGS